ncbi:MAG TPA: LppX_LprAFG lipoprotein [Dehalococcoidia bacterium]|nr:LppX_LprAFG lipoprotein [Dehalococcoidia bacterium]
MKKLLFPLTFLLCLLLFACGSDSEIDSSAILEITNTPIVETVPTSKPVITQLAPITPTVTATQIVIPTKMPQKSITQNNNVSSTEGDSESVVDIISRLGEALDSGYSHHSTLKMNMTISFDDYLEEMPLLMEGDVQNSRNYKGVTSFEDNNQIQMIEMIVFDQETFAKYPDTKYWIQFPEDQTPVNPISIIEFLKKNFVEGTLVGTEKSGGVSSQHVSWELDSKRLGELLPVLGDSTGILKLDMWVESDSSQIGRFLINGLAIGGPKVKGPDGQEVTVKVDIEMSSWDFGKPVELTKPDLPSSPEPMVWDLPEGPEMMLDLQQDYSATIKIYGGGEIKIDLLEDEAPVTVNNFIFLSNHGYYDWVTFHRVIPDFMAQGGDPSGTGRGGPGYHIDNEFHPDARHDSAGVVSMANSGLRPDGHGTNGSQFFITYREAPFLDGLNSDGTIKDCNKGSCHTVFGRVIEGMNVLGSIFPRDPETANLPGDVIETIKIKSVPK